MEVRKMGGIRLLTMDEKPANTLTPVVLHELAGLLRDLEKVCTTIRFSGVPSRTKRTQLSPPKST